MTAPPVDRLAGKSPAGPWVTIAKVLRPHGLRGTLRLKPIVPDVDLLLESPPEKVWIRVEDEMSGPFVLESIKMANDCLHLRLEGLDRREEADAFVHGDLMIPEAELWELPEGWFYAFELEGFTLIDKSTGQALGVVVGTREGAAHDYLEMRASEGSPVALVPYCDPMIVEVRKERREVVVDLPRGLLEAPVP